MRKVRGWVIYTSLFLTCLLGIPVITTHVVESLQYLNDQDIATDISNMYLSESPLADPVDHVVPGKEYFLNFNAYRKRNCTAMIRWTLRKHLDSISGNFVVYGLGDYWTNATEGAHTIAESVKIPDSAAPGLYEIDRLATYSCTNGSKSSTIVNSITFLVK